jgi:alpha-glucosidase
LVQRVCIVLVFVRGRSDLGDDRLHTAFNFDFLMSPWDAASLRKVIDTTLDAHTGVGAPPTWVLANHDVTRVVTRLGRKETGLARRDRARLFGSPTDRELGQRRARAAALLLLALPGSAYIYQGDELGLDEVEDLPQDLLQDPTWLRTGGEFAGRDGCRVPLPWQGTTRPFGFGIGETSAAPWLPQPDRWRRLTAEVQAGDPGSMLHLYRKAIGARRELRQGAFAWDRDDGPVLSFSRGDDFRCAVNLADRAVDLPAGEILVVSAELGADTLPPDTAVWLRL